MTRASFLLIALCLVLPSCNSVSLGGSEQDGGSQPGGGNTVASGSGGAGGGAGTGAIDAPVMGGQSGGASGTNPCKGLEIPDFDCGYGTPTYICVARDGGWVWDYTCPERPSDGGPSDAQHPYVSRGDGCLNYPTSGYRVFPYDPSIRGDRSWPLCTLNCTTVTPAYGPAGVWPALDQALPAGACEDEGATCDSPVMTGWCSPCANGGGPGNGYTCVCRGHNWHCALVSQGMNVCQGYACVAPSVTTPPPASCSTTTWSSTQVCTCGVCRDLCDSNADCRSGRCNLNQVCKPSSNKCTGPDECPAPCRGLCESVPDGGVVDSAPATGCDVNKASQALSAAGLTTVGAARTLNEDLPADLASGANWGVKQIACRAGGYDLSAVAGKNVCLVSFATTGSCQRLPATAWVVMSEGTVRCIYQSADLNPGIYSVHDTLCSTPDAGATSCPGPNPAARTCRTSASDCISSSCSCGSYGSWACTEDCRPLPLCNADGGTACSGARIDNTQAASALAQYIKQLKPGLNPATTFGAEEKTVPNLWDTMQAQLFFGKMYAEDGSVWQEVSFLYRQCAVTLPTEDTTFGLIESGVVANGAFYYSWSYGSGIYRSNLGKLVPDGASLARTTGPGYRNPGSGPPGLVVALEDARLVVYRATVYWAKFNEWLNPEPMGYLKDLGDRLAVVDGNGQELSSTLP